MIRVMLVDDQIILAEGIKSVLETSGDIQVCGIAADGAQALNLAQKANPDVILMDIRMPGMNGVGAPTKIKEGLPDVKII